MRRILSTITILVSFLWGGISHAQTLAEKTQNSLQELTKAYNTEIAHNDEKGLELLKIELVQNTKNGKDSHLLVNFTETGIQYTLQYTQKALQNPELLAPALTLLKALKYYWLDSKIYIASEIRYNAQRGSIMGMYNLAVQELDLLKYSSPRTEVETLLSQNDEALRLKIREEVDKAFIDTEKNRVLLEKKAVTAQKAGYKAIEKWRQQTKVLNDYEKQTEKLNDLLLKNDRKGVRKMLQAYLPWPVMEPLEIQMWTRWLEAIENPNPNKTITALRGVSFDTDKVQTLKLANGETRMAFMSSVLTKNQGNYTRRLRSLTTNRETVGRPSSLIPGSVITQQFKSHSSNPISSSFLSFTLIPDVAKNFIGQKIAMTPQGPIYVANGGMLVVRMDERRLFSNLASGHSHEIEFLAPLVVFPDEVVAFQEGEFKTMQPDGTLVFDEAKYKLFFEGIRQKTGYDFMNDTKLVSTFLPSGRKFLAETTRQPVAGMCERVFN